MSLRKQIVMQMNNSTHTSSLHKSQIMFVFKYFLPRLQNVWGGWERVIREYKDSRDLKSSLLKTNCAYLPKEYTSNLGRLPSFGQHKERPSCSGADRGGHAFSAKGAETASTSTWGIRCRKYLL